MTESFKKILIGAFIIALLGMLWAHNTGYDYSIDWEVTTTGEVIEFPAWSLETPFFNHEIKGEKYLLTENYSGSEIKRNLTLDQGIIAALWVALCILLTYSTYLRRYGFFVTAALFALFINRLNLFEVGLFGIQDKTVVLIPFVLLITPLIVFHEFKKKTPFFLRVLILLILSGSLLFGLDNQQLFTDHFIAHSLFGFAICGLLFLFIISEEIVFGILYVITSGKGGSSNHLHFIVLSVAYLANIIFYYLNKSGLFENSLFYFNPYIILTISSIVALWTLKYKSEYLLPFIGRLPLFGVTLSLGFICFAFLTLQFVKGNDSVFEAFHYFILYTHLGFGVMFFLYILTNFIDPLIKGFQIHKIAYKERNFPYATARLGGIVTILAVYFLSGQESYNLLRTGYYNYLAKYSETEGNMLLANEYTIQASYLGYNTHMANYNLGWSEWKKNNEYQAKTYFLSAAQRFPSAYAFVNYGNLDAEVNPNKVQAIYEERLRNSSNGELENNLGVLHLRKGEIKKALVYFEDSSPSEKWNNAPLTNKWNALKRLKTIDSISLVSDYNKGNYGVKANILTTQISDSTLDFSYRALESSSYLHRQAYLLNSLYLFTDDSLESFARREIERSSDGNFNSKMRKAIAIHLYNKGRVNDAFMMMDYLQLNAPEYYRGDYLDALGKFALSQNALKLSLEFFNEALDQKHLESIFGKIEVLSRMDKKDEITQELLEVLKENPELTNQVNQFLTQLETSEIRPFAVNSVPKIDSLSDEELNELGRRNAFNEDQVLAVYDELARRETSGGYELLVDAIEINPYSKNLLKKYAFAALNWNLIEYADQTVEKLKELTTESELALFLKNYNIKKEQLAQDTW